MGRCKQYGSVAICLIWLLRSQQFYESGTRMSNPKKMDECPLKRDFFSKGHFIFQLPTRIFQGICLV